MQIRDFPTDFFCCKKMQRGYKLMLDSKSVGKVVAKFVYISTGLSAGTRSKVSNWSLERRIDRSDRRFAKILIAFGRVCPSVGVDRGAASSLLLQMDVSSVTIFGEISPLWRKIKDLWQFFEGILRIWQIFLPNSAFGPIFIIVNGPNWKQNLTIWSHWMSVSSVTRRGERKLNRDLLNPN